MRRYTTLQAFGIFGAIASSVLALMVVIIQINTDTSKFMVALLSIIAAVALSSIAQGCFGQRFPSAYNIAVIGSPQSGKTTFITSLFREIFEQNIKGLDVKLTSTSTIERVNEDLKRLQQGKAILPTRGDDIFPYRADLTLRGLLFPTIYQVQIGDFPGEDSEQYVKAYGEWLHPPPFFKWATGTDALVFMIDLSHMIDRDGKRELKYIATMTAAIRAAWQNLLTDNTNERRPTKSKPLAIRLYAK